MQDVGDPSKHTTPPKSEEHKIEKATSEDEDGGGPGDYDEDDDGGNDPFITGFGSHPDGGRGVISSTMRALSGMIPGSGTASRLREILENLKQKEDSSAHLIALEELSHLLLVSTEDNLSGHFAPDQFVRELVILMQPNEFGEENNDIQLLACRCIANLMEALPPATANVVYGGAVPVLCQALMNIMYMEIAEQALSVRHLD